MDAKNLAGQLAGSEYPFGLTREQNAAARASGLVVVYGASDDLMEFEGAICEEVGCCEGRTVWLDKEDLIPSFESIDKKDKNALREYFRREGGGKSIVALWCADDISWTYKTDIPHETFDIVEGDRIYCRGIVFRLEDVR